MNILVTGATGFIGRHLVKSLEMQGSSVNAFVREDCEFNTTKNTISNKMKSPIEL